MERLAWLKAKVVIFFFFLSSFRTQLAKLKKDFENKKAYKQRQHLLKVTHGIKRNFEAYCTFTIMSASVSRFPAQEEFFSGSCSVTEGESLRI